MADGGWGFNQLTSAGCRERIAEGAAIEPTRDVSDLEQNRVLRYSFDASAFDRASLDICAALGDVTVEPSQSSNLTVEVRISGGSPELRDKLVTHVAFAQRDGTLNVASWQAAVEHRWRLGEQTFPSLTVVVKAPESLVYAITLTGSSADLRVSDLRVSNLTLDSKFGDVRASGVLMEGNVHAATRSGDIVLNFTSVQSGAILADTRFGDIDIALPNRADTGYDAYVDTNFGDVHVNIGAAEIYEGGHGQDETHVRTAGYAEKPTKVEVRAETRSGDVRIVAS